MLKSITWHQLIAALFLVTLAYYSVIIFIYYKYLIASFKPEKIKFWSGKKKFEQMTNTYDENLFDRTSLLAKNLKVKIHEASKQDVPKQEFLFTIQSELKKYHDIIGTPFQPAINNLVEDTSLKECSIYLSAEELGSLWKS